MLDLDMKKLWQKTLMFQSVSMGNATKWGPGYIVSLNEWKGVPAHSRRSYVSIFHPGSKSNLLHAPGIQGRFD